MSYRNLRIFILMLISPHFLMAITDSVHFENKLSWKQIQQKAKTENKYIFIDVVATWCSPCKMMDKFVYSTKSVGSFLNEKFICIKVQIDSSKNDNAFIKSWYKDAAEIKKSFKINALPGYLFFTPDGKAVHRSLGYQGDSVFLKTAAAAFNPHKQYYTLLNEYTNGRVDYSVMPYLARTTKNFNELELSDRIASDYINNYLLNRKDSTFWSRDNLFFMKEFTQNSKDASFELIYHHCSKVDEIGGREFSRGLVDLIISKEEIFSKLQVRNEKPGESYPNWDSIRNIIGLKYDISTAARVVVGSQLKWYSSLKKYKEVAKYNFEQIDLLGLDISDYKKFDLNNMLWEIFLLHVQDSNYLTRAIAIAQLIVTDKYSEVSPGYFAEFVDTYANLLYKAGRMKEALIWQQKAVDMFSTQEMKDHLDKMKHGEKTWPENSN